MFLWKNLNFEKPKKKILFGQGSGQSRAHLFLDRARPCLAQHGLPSQAALARSAWAATLAWARPAAGPVAPACAGPAGPLGFQKTLAHARVSETLVCRAAKTQGRGWRLGMWRRLGLMRRRATETAAAAALKINISGNFKLQNFLCPLMAYIIF